MSDAGAGKLRQLSPVPVRHGMTVGELAKLYNAERHINANLTVVPMRGLDARRLVRFDRRSSG